MGSKLGRLWILLPIALLAVFVLRFVYRGAEPVWLFPFTIAVLGIVIIARSVQLFFGRKRIR